jgi:hypothetical protein
VAFLAVIYLWFIGILAMQKQFGAFHAAGLTTCVMLLYFYTKPPHRDSGNNASWQRAGS